MGKKENMKTALPVKETRLVEEEAEKKRLREMAEEQMDDVELIAALASVTEIAKARGSIFLGFLVTDKGIRLTESWAPWSAIQVQEGIVGHQVLPRKFRENTDPVKTINWCINLLSAVENVHKDIVRAMKVVINVHKVKMGKNIGPPDQSNSAKGK